MTTVTTEARAPGLRQVPPIRRTALHMARRVAFASSQRLARAVGRTIGKTWALLLRLRARCRHLPPADRVCLGSGNAPLPGWLNVDLEGPVDLRLDLRGPLTLRSGSVRWLYSEHLIEHLTLEDGLALLRECRRVLHEDGVLRFAAPDLDALVEAYRGAWREQDWVQWPGHEWIDSPARMLNTAFRAWGHQYLYDAEELQQRLREAGFSHTRVCTAGESEHGELAGLETRADSKLVVEAWGQEENAP